MVDKTLIDNLKRKINNGVNQADSDDILLSFELIKQISKEVDYLKKDVEKSDYICQFNYSDYEKAYWIKVSNGDVTYDKGKIVNPSFVITTSKDIGLGMLFGEVDANIISPLGKLKVEGNFTELRLFQELYEDTIDEFKKKYFKKKNID